MEELLVVVAGFVGGFFSTLASNGSSVTLPALGLLGLPEHVANGTNRLSGVALGLIGTVHFARQRLIDWREGARIAALIALGAVAGSLAAVDLGDAALDAIVIAGLLVVLALLLSRPGRWLEGRGGEIGRFGWGQAVAYLAIGVYAGLVVLCSGFFMLAALVLLTGYDLRRGNAMKAFVLLVVGLQSLVVFRQRGSRLERRHPARAWQRGRGLRRRAAGHGEGARVWVYRFLVLVVVLSVVQLLVVDSGKYLQHT